MKKTPRKSKKIKENNNISNNNIKNLLDEVAKFREVNRKYLLQNLYGCEQTKNYKIIQSNNTSDVSI
jgi:hypothetical protein